MLPDYRNADMRTLVYGLRRELRNSDLHNAAQFVSTWESLERISRDIRRGTFDLVTVMESK